MRDQLRLVRAALRKPEEVGTIANDYLADVLVTSICKGGDTFVDVGAHVGMIIAGVRQHDPGIRIIAIEAMPDKVEVLRRKFPQVEIHDCAVGREEGDATFYVNAHETAYSSLVSSDGMGEGVREIPVKVRTLDGLIPEDMDVDVIKMDIEGSELDALHGGTRVLTTNRPLVMFESGGPDYSSIARQTGLFNFFHERDYAVVVPNRLAHNDDGLSEQCFVESHLYPRRTTNYFGVPTDRRIVFRDRARRVLGHEVNAT
jgi:FkbM family methyltransferase